MRAVVILLYFVCLIASFSSAYAGSLGDFEQDVIDNKGSDNHDNKA